jgi:hypothetical protein
MEVFISIDGVLRNTIQKFDYHYKDYFLNTETTEEETFEYGINGSPTSIENLLNSYRFQSIDEFNKFLYLDFPIEIYGHAGLSYNQASTDFNRLVFENPDINFTIVGLSEKGKAKPSSLFFLSKNGIICNNILFSNPNQIKELWKKCDLWVTDDINVINNRPKNKRVIKYVTYYNNDFTFYPQINKLSEINKEWLKYSGKTITSTLMQLVKNVKQEMCSKMKMGRLRQKSIFSNTK